LDKIAILTIKQARVRQCEKLGHIRRELAELEAVRDRTVPARPEITSLAEQLKAVNEKLWDIEDSIRACEARHNFGPRFVELARAVYRTNDELTAIERRINDALGSELTEEKQYPWYE